jgi:hypothetical protein
MLKKIMETIGTVNVGGVENIVSTGDKGETDKDKREVAFKVNDIVMVNDLMIGKVKSIKGDDVQVLHVDGKVTTAKVGTLKGADEVANIVIKD